MKQLLIVDNEETILFALKRYFSRLRFRVDAASELEEAEALVAHTRYDLAILDLSLTTGGSTEGLEILRFLHARSPKTHAILLTAFGTPSIEREALRRGARTVLHKPQPLPEIARVADVLLGAQP
jgi:two-component system, response regulator RegA